MEKISGYPIVIKMREVEMKNLFFSTPFFNDSVILLKEVV